METILIEISKTETGYLADIVKQPISQAGVTPFDAVGRLLRKINNVETWLQNSDLLMHPLSTEIYLMNTRRFVERFNNGRELE